MGEKTATLFMELLDNLSNVEYVTQYFKWNLIKVDPDDNKFTDCAIASNAEFLASNEIPMIPNQFHISLQLKLLRCNEDFFSFFWKYELIVSLILVDHKKILVTL